MTTSTTDVDSAANKRTLIGVGLVSLLRAPLVQPSEPQHAMPSVQVSGEIAAAERRRMTSRTRVAVLPTMPDPTRRLKLVVVVAAAVAASIVIGFQVRDIVDDRPAQKRVATTSSAKIVGTKSVVSTATVAKHPAPPSDRGSTGLSNSVPATIATPPSDRGSAAPANQAVDLGDGSCSAFIDAKGGGELLVDDQVVGTPPITVTGLWCGSRSQLRVQRSGFATWSKTIVTQEGRTSRLVATLRRLPTPAPAPTPAPTTANPVFPFHTLLDWTPGAL